MRLPAYRMFEIRASEENPNGLQGEWHDIVVCRYCKHNVGGYCTNKEGRFNQFVARSDYCSRGEE